MNLAHKAIKNTVFSLIGYIGPILVLFFTIPVLIKGMGVGVYGFYVLISTVTGIISLLDFGWIYTFAQQLSADPTQKNLSLLRGFFTTALLGNAAVGILVFVVLSFLPQLTFSILHLPVESVNTYRIALILSGINFFIRSIYSPWLQIPYALQKLEFSTGFYVIMLVVTQVFGVIAVLLGYGLTGFMLAQLVSALIGLFVAVFVAHRIAPKLVFPLSFSRESMRVVKKNGTWIFFINIATNFFAQLDKLVLGIFWGTVQVTYYASAQMVTERIQSTSLSLSHAFFPLFSYIGNVRDSAEIQDIFRRSFRVIIMITAGLTMSAVVFGDLLLKYWLSADIATNAAKAIPILGFTYFILSIFSFLQTFLSGRNMLKLLGSTLLVMTALDLGAMIYFIPRMGVIGASIAYAFGSLPVIVLLYIIEIKFWGMSFSSFSRFYLPVFAQMAIIASAIGGFSFIFLRQLATNLFFVIILGGGIFAAYLSIYVWCGFLPKQERDSVTQFFKNKLLWFNFKKYV